MAVRQAVPADAEVDDFVRAVQDAGVQLTGLNFFAGDMPGGDRGLVSWPARSAEFRDNIDVVVAIAGRLGTRAFNALYGNRVDDSTPQEQDEVATANLAAAGQAVGAFGGIVLVEPVSGAPRYPILTAAEALSVIDRVHAAGRQRAPTTSGCSATSTTSRSTTTTSTTPCATSARSATCRSPTPRVAGSPGPASWTWTATWHLAGRRIRRLRRAGVQAHHDHRGEPGLAASREESIRMSTIAFIGLGIMGGPMAAHLVKAGHDVVGYNLSRPPVDRLVEAGGRGADSIAEAVSGADVVITMVPDSPDVELVAMGDGGSWRTS